MNWIIELIAGLGFAVLLRLFVLNISRIQGSSMVPTLQNHDWVLVWRLPYRFHAPKRQDVVICHYPGRRMKRCKWLPQTFVKRVVGLPGDTIEIIEGVIHINGTPLDEDYLDPEHCRFQRTRPLRTLGPNEYFVMGDNRDRSNDSRSVGPIRRLAVRGQVVCVFWPPQRAQKVR